MIQNRILVLTAVLTSLATPAHTAETKVKQRDAAIECGAFFTIMAQKSDVEAEAAQYSDFSTLLFSVAEARLESMGVSVEEQGRIGADAVTRINEQMTTGGLGIKFSDCHAVMEGAIETLMPGVLTPFASDLLVCASQFLHALQSGEYDDATNADFQVASDYQFSRAQINMTDAGMTAEEQEQAGKLYGLSVGMVLGMGEEPLISWERCGEV